MMVVLKVIGGIVFFFLGIAAILVATVGPAVVFFIWGWKAALGTWFVVGGIQNLVTAINNFVEGARSDV